MVCHSHVVHIVASVLCSLLSIANSAAAYTGYCITGTTEVYMPSHVNGECYCGAQIIDPDGGYARGYCSPFAPDEGLEFRGCVRGDSDEFGPNKKNTCQYYCECLDIKQNPDTGKITCCKPGERFGLQDKVITAAPAPPPPSTFEPHTTMTNRLLTTGTTTTEPYYGAQTLFGTMELSTEIPFKVQPEAFINNVEVVKGVADGIAMKLGVNNSWVTAALSLPGRYIQVDYRINVPTNTTGNISAWGLFVGILMSSDEAGLSDWANNLSIGMTKSTSVATQVAVHKVLEPTTWRTDSRGSASGAIRPDGNSLLLMAFPHLLRWLWALFS